MSKIRLHGSSSGYTEIAPVAASGNNTLTLPDDGTIISKDAAGAVGVTSVRATNAHFSGTTRVTTGITTTATITTGTITTAKVTTIQDASGNNSSTPAEIETGRAKAWIKFNGNTTGAILGSYGISSISNPDDGEYIITFSTAFADTNYVATACVSGNASIHRGMGIEQGVTTTTTCRVNIFSTSAGGDKEDTAENGMAFFGAQ